MKNYNVEDGMIVYEKVQFGSTASQSEIGVATTGEKVFRWLQVFTFMLVSLQNGMLWITFAPISNSIKDYYHLESYFWVNSWVLDGGVKQGLRVGLYIGAIGTAISAVIRAIPTTNFGIVVVGQMVGALVQPFILNAPPVLAANWFPASQRTIATTFCSLANPVGVAVGYVLPPLIVTSANEDVVLLMVIEAISAVVICTIAILILRDKPKVPPSLSSSESNAHHEPFTKALKLILTNPSFLILLIVFGCGLGAFNTLATLLNQILLPNGYNDDEVGAFGASVVVMGIIGSGIFGAFVDWKHKYKLSLLVTLFFALLALILMITFLQPDRFWVLFVGVSIFGFCLTPIIPLSLELSAEITFPLKEGTPSGLLMTSGQIVGIFLIIAMEWMITNAWYRLSVCLVLMFLLISFGLLFFLKEDLKRHNFTREKETNSDAK